MKKALPIIIVVIVVIAGVAAYALTRNNNKKSGDTASSMSNMDTSKQSSSDTASTPTATNSVTIKDFAFSPASITVKKGTAVTWINQDSVAHTITETDGQDGPKSQDLASGQSYSFTYNTAGTFKYDCSIHTNMTGTVTVTE
jgi:plastocyanin